MAEIVIAAGSSHGPSIQRPPESWAKLAEKDTRDPRFDYAALQAKARSGLEAEIALPVQRQRHAAAAKALARLQERLREKRLDAAVVVSNAHHIDRCQPHPVFGLLRAETFPAAESIGMGYDPSQGKGIFESEAPSPSIQQMPGHPILANHILDELIRQEFDVAAIDILGPGVLLDEAFSFCYRWLFAGAAIPVVPFYLSRDLPNQATPKRCVDLGRALRKAINSFPSPLRIGLVASGGLSHQVVNEELDRYVVDKLRAADLDALSGLPRGLLNEAPGTPEILNWVTVAAAMAPVGMDLIDYLPCYRSVASTGHGVCFGLWPGSANGA